MLLPKPLRKQLRKHRNLLLPLALALSMLVGAVPAPAATQTGSVRATGGLTTGMFPAPTHVIAGQRPIGHLYAKHYRHGKYLGQRDFGPGLVTNVGVNFMAWNDATTAITTSSLQALQFMAIGTGATAAASSDYYLQTANGATSLSGTTNGYMTGAPTVVAPNKLQYQATFTATGSIAVTEWVLTMSNATNFSRTETGTPTSTTFPDSGAAFTTAGQGLKGWTIEINSAAINTSPTTTNQALVTSNTATQLNMTGGWWHLDNSAGSTPSASSAYVVYPTAFDHKVFAAVNVVSGDSIQFTYTLTLASGG